jgi:hypothetical protein
MPVLAEAVRNTKTATDKEFNFFKIRKYISLPPIESSSPVFEVDFLSLRGRVSVHSASKVISQPAFISKQIEIDILFIFERNL